MFLKILGVSMLFTLLTHAIINPDILIEQRQEATYKAKIKVIEQKIEGSKVTLHVKVVSIYRGSRYDDTPPKRPLVIKELITICYTHRKLAPRVDGAKPIPLLTTSKHYIAYLNYHNECFHPSARSYSFQTLR
jgi:hypothetical protein